MSIGALALCISSSRTEVTIGLTVCIGSGFSSCCTTLSDMVDADVTCDFQVLDTTCHSPIDVDIEKVSVEKVDANILSQRHCLHRKRTKPIRSIVILRTPSLRLSDAKSLRATLSTRHVVKRSMRKRPRLKESWRNWMKKLIVVTLPSPATKLFPPLSSIRLRSGGCKL